MNKTYKIYRALFDFEPQNEYDIPDKGLSFKFGDVLHIINDNDEEWWQAKHVVGIKEDEVIGIIPSKKRCERIQKCKESTVQFQGCEIQKEKVTF